MNRNKTTIQENSLKSNLEILSDLSPIKWENHQLYLLDQRLLPHQEVWVPVQHVEDCFLAIKDMVVRGAPCIGFAAIFGMALWCKDNPQGLLLDFKRAAQYLNSARPTAVNLSFEINRCVKMAEMLESKGQFHFLYQELVKFGFEQISQSHHNNLSMAKTAAEELTRKYGERPLRLMTHCNTGYLACGSLGTALGVVTYMNQLKRVEKVWVDETRPYMQGSRLTAYELSKLEIPYHVVVEGAASYLMREKLVDAIFVGADRITHNGDTANKIGTSTLAIVANFYQIPFYVVAPLSSCDFDMKTGKEIEIELRDEKEILEMNGHRLAPQLARSLNPSFDVTAKDLISGIICEKGIIYPQKGETLEKVRPKRVHTDD